MHLLIPTHTTRHLAACLTSIAWQHRAPDSVVVTCDTGAAEIPELLNTWWPRIARCLVRRGASAIDLLHVSRPHQGEARLNQVRNNGLRALDSRGLLHDHDLVVVLDGDTMLDPDAILLHARRAAENVDLVIPYRINTDESLPAKLNPGAMLGELEQGGHCVQEEQLLAGQMSRAQLEQRAARYRTQLALRRFARFLTKPHKPKILGGHHAVSVRCLRAVNGYDEEYTGYGYDDDDLSRRLHRLRPHPRVSIDVDTILAYHLWHPTRAPARPTDAPGFKRFARSDLPTAAAHGWRSPLPQPEPVIRIVTTPRA